ncbi:MAG: Lrp/AsnC family transcriptional regulator [Deltaproteobacteria bacterium]|nr:Lrp/AsnC family transcriptional regulator [Deltaproteobacteria bacterium]
MLTSLEKRVIGKMAGDIPVCDRPYAAVAEELGLTEDEVLGVLVGLQKKGVMRRLGATLFHQSAGFGANAMVAMKVDGDRVDEVGEAVAGFSGVTHCYHRPGREEWPYNLYAMIHGPDEDACRKMADSLTAKVKVADFLVLFSVQELKKTSMGYFPADEDD